MYNSISITGKREDIINYQENLRNQENIDIIIGLGDEISEDGLSNFDVADAVVKIIIGIAGSASLGAVLVEYIKSKNQNISIKLIENNIELNITNAKKADNEELIKLICSLKSIQNTGKSE